MFGWSRDQEMHEIHSSFDRRLKEVGDAVVERTKSLSLAGEHTFETCREVPADPQLDPLLQPCLSLTWVAVPWHSSTSGLSIPCHFHFWSPK